MSDGVRTDSVVLAVNWLTDANVLRAGTEYDKGVAAGLERAARDLLDSEIDNA